MNDKKTKPAAPKRSTIAKTISLPPELLERAEKRAADLNRNFSNYVAQLILADAEAAA